MTVSRAHGVKSLSLLSRTKRLQEGGETQPGLNLQARLRVGWRREPVPASARSPALVPPPGTVRWRSVPQQKLPAPSIGSLPTASVSLACLLTARETQTEADGDYVAFTRPCRRFQYLIGFFSFSLNRMKQVIFARVGRKESRLKTWSKASFPFCIPAIIH